MARTNTIQVKQIIDTALTDPEIDDIISFSNRMTTTILASASLTSAELKDIETYLTAHIIAITKERQTKEERVGDVWIKYYDHPTGWLEQTTFGQTVMVMDTSGLFQKQAKKRASFKAINQVAR